MAPVKFDDNRKLKRVLDWVDVQDDDGHNKGWVSKELAGGVADSGRSPNFSLLRIIAD